MTIFFPIMRKLQEIAGELKGQQAGRLALVSVLVLLVGVAGIYLFEFRLGVDGKPVNEALNSVGDVFWWGIVTMTTVGYGDIYPVTPGGRLVAGAFMLFGIGFLGTFLGMLASVFVERRRKEELGLTKLGLSGHIIICGYRYMTREIIEELRADDPSCQVVIIDDRLEQNPIDDPNIFFVRGVSSEKNVLRRAGVERARTAIVLAEDPGNPKSDGKTILTVLAIETINRGVYTCAELVDPGNEEYLIDVHVDEIINSSEITSCLLVQSAQDHGITRLVGQLLTNRAGQQLYRVQLTQGLFDRVEPGAATLPFARMLQFLKEHEDVLPVALERGEQYLSNPSGQEPVSVGQWMFCIAARRPAW
jgi:voltage-gated potassium channel